MYMHPVQLRGHMLSGPIRSSRQVEDWGNPGGKQKSFSLQPQWQNCCRSGTCHHFCHYGCRGFVYCDVPQHPKA